MHLQWRIFVKPSAKAEIERVQKLANQSARLRQEADELQAKSEALHSRVEKVRERMAQLGLKQKASNQPKNRE
jgi:phage shock protein A